MLQGDVQVLPHRQRLEHARGLHLDAHALLHARERACRASRRAAEADVAAERRVGADDQLEQRALAGAVRADQAVDLACSTARSTSVDGEKATEALADFCDLQQRRSSSASFGDTSGARGAARARQRARPSRRRSPLGTNSTVATSSAPIRISAAFLAVDRQRLEPNSSTNVPTKVAVRSDRPENATQTIGMAAAGRPMLDGVMNWPQEV